MKLLLLTAVLALCHLEVRGQDDYCFGKDTERTQTRHFNSKTAYQIIKGTNIDKQYLVPGCSPKKIWIFHRHGTRLPEEKVIQKAPLLDSIRDEIVKNYRVRGNRPTTNPLCQEDLIALQMWKWNTSITVDKQQYLTTQGYEDLKGTAKLYQRYFYEVLPKNYNNTYYYFRHTETQRTTESFKAFTEGLFGLGNDAEAAPIPDKDLLLRPYDYCSSWRAQNYEDEGSEAYKFKRSQIYNNTLAEISTRLGFQYTLDVDTVELMYDICRYEQAWHVDRTSVWCAAFTPNQVTVLEYAEDLKYYYKLGYGFEDNTRLNCRAVQDMLTHLNSPSSPKVIAYFGHSSGIQTLISALGIDKDDIKLTASNYNELSDRRWMTSNIDPFAANFVAVKYQCDADLVDKEKVIFFLNQDAVSLSWCNVGLCNWSEVMKRYDTLYKADCNEFYCLGGGAAAVRTSLVSLLLAAIVYLIY